MKKKIFILQLSLFILFLLLVIWKMNKSMRDSKEIGEKLSFEYKELEVSDSICMKVFDIYIVPSNWRGTQFFKYISTTEGEKYLITISHCINDPEKNLDNVLETGDSIIKKGNSDTLVIKKNSGQYFFKMDLSE
jgi:hypothetical protein